MVAIRNYELLTHSLTGVKCRATSVAKNYGNGHNSHQMMLIFDKKWSLIWQILHKFARLALRTETWCKNIKKRWKETTFGCHVKWGGKKNGSMVWPPVKWTATACVKSIVWVFNSNRYILKFKQLHFETWIDTVCNFYKHVYNHANSWECSENFLSKGHFLKKKKITHIM